MKAVFLPAIILAALSANQGQAYEIVSRSVNCQYKPNVNSGWESRSAANPYTQDDGLHIEFVSGSGMDSVQTTETDGEYKVEAKCSGTVIVRNNKPFKIRDFIYQVDNAEIANGDGSINLVAQGWAYINNTDTKDDFGKTWNVKKGDLSNNAWAGKAESQTVCGSELKLQFDDLHGTVIRKQGSSDRSRTVVELSQLLIHLDPC